MRKVNFEKKLIVLLNQISTDIQVLTNAIGGNIKDGKRNLHKEEVETEIIEKREKEILNITKTEKQLLYKQNRLLFWSVVVTAVIAIAELIYRLSLRL